MILLTVFRTFASKSVVGSSSTVMRWKVLVGGSLPGTNVAQSIDTVLGIPCSRMVRLFG